MTGPGGFKARPTLYKGIQMRSRLEADFASALDRDGLKWEYEPDCFAGPDGQWLPDFKIVYSEDRTSYIEVKPAGLLAYEYDLAETCGRVDKVLQKMAVAWLSEPGAFLVLTFWSYGTASAALTPTICGHPGNERYFETWFFTPETDDVPPTLWPGMGQLLRSRRRGPA